MQKLTKLGRFWPLTLLLLLTFVLRIWRLEELFYFTYDESIPAFVGRRLIIFQHVPLIGGVTPFGFHLAPYFYWFYSGLLYIGNLNPIVWGYASALIAPATTFLMYLVGKNFGDKKLGFIAASLWAFSYLANIYDRHLWALYWGPLVSLVTLFSLLKIIQGNKKFTYILTLTIALSLHADPSNLVFLVLSVISWIIYKLPIKKSTFIALGIILLSFFPLLIFDLRHNFANTKPVLEFWKQGRNNPGFETSKFQDNSLLIPQTLSRTVYTNGNNEIAKQYSYCLNFVEERFQAVPKTFLIFSIITIVAFVLWSHTKKSKDGKWHLLGLLVLIYYFGIQLYGTFFRADIFEHYITGLFPTFLLIVAFLISKLPRGLWLLGLALFVGFNLYKLLITQNSLGLAVKRQAIEYTMQQVGDKEFSLDSLSTCWKYNGYRYLFAVFGREPVKSYVDPNFAHLYGTTPVAEKHPKTVVAFIVHDFVPEIAEFYKRYALLKSHQISSSTFGNIEVIIMDNSTGWFD